MMSRSRSATGWSAGATLLAALVGSLAGSAAGVAAAAAGGGVGAAAAGSFLAVSLWAGAAFSGSTLAVSGLPGSAAGAATTSDFLVSAGFSVVFTGAGADASVLTTSGLKSLTVGGGTLAGSGRGIAASIASSAALLRDGSVCPSAEDADTARKVAATANSTRSYPARWFERSRIISSPGRCCLDAKLLAVSSVSRVLLRRRPDRFGKRIQSAHRIVSECTPSSGMPARNNSYADDTRAPLLQPALRGASHDKLTSSIRLAADCALLPRSRPFVCHRQATVRMFRNRARFNSFPTPNRRSRCRSARLVALGRNRRPPPRRSSDRASSGQFSIGAQPRTSGRDNVRSRSG